MNKSNASNSQIAAIVYKVILGVMLVCIFLGFIPGLEFASSWLTPPVSLFVGLAFDLRFGETYAKLN